MVTKKSTSANTAELRNADSVRAEMKTKAAEAVRQLANAKVTRVSEPVRAEIRVVPPARLSMLRGVPGVALSPEGNAVSFAAKDFAAAYDGLVSLIGVATLAYPAVQNEVIRDHPDSTSIRRLQRERLMMRWFDVESGRWSPPPVPAPAPGRKYYGAQ